MTLAGYLARSRRLTLAQSNSLRRTWSGPMLAAVEAPLSGSIRRLRLPGGGRASARRPF